ncbi:MAG: hypothetical protein GF375_04130, partial [Candidatus Omnitrophica bacterium]|nr:hypothetical protein [Candidatus Omnitrophota bacterium]MBD3269237.1 hypothetical protein [Candidatus Omnitrophota bacterium]
IFDLAFSKGADTIQFIQPIREDALIFKRFNKETKGTHPNSVSKATFRRIKEMQWGEDKEKAIGDHFNKCYAGVWFLSQRNLKGTTKKGKNQIIEQLGLDADKKTAVVFSHVLWDANLFYGEDLFEDYEEWFVETLKAACNNPNLNWIIKLHPASLWKKNLDGVTGELREQVLIRQNIGKLPAHVHVLSPDTDINTLSLFNLADYGITVRGTTGIELPCFGKPVFTAGTGRYYGLGFTIDSETREDYLDKLSKIESFPPLTHEQTLLAKKHAFAIFNLRPWIMKSFKAQFSYKTKGSRPLDHNLYPRIFSRGKLFEADDLKAFSRWVLQQEGCDYLNSRM